MVGKRKSLFQKNSVRNSECSSSRNEDHLNNLAFSVIIPKLIRLWRIRPRIMVTNARAVFFLIASINVSNNCFEVDVNVNNAC